MKSIKMFFNLIIVVCIIGCNENTHNTFPNKDIIADSVKYDNTDEFDTTSLTSKQLVSTDNNDLSTDSVIKGPYYYLRNNWNPQMIKASANSGNPTVKDFLDAYYSYYQNQPNDYCSELKDIQEFVYSEVDDYNIEDIKNGFIRHEDPFNIVQCCIWNRSNRHILIAIDWSHESDGWLNALCFFDYDPQTKLMSLEDQLTDKFYNDKHGYVTYFVELPQKGKDIHLVESMSRGPEMDLKWNGYDFDFAE